MNEPRQGWHLREVWFEDGEPTMHREPSKPEPVAWQILNGVCHAGIRLTEDLAKQAADGMQKSHDLGGSLAAFHTRPLYTAPPQRPWQGLTEQDTLQIRAEWEVRDYRLSELCRAIEAKLKEKNA